MYYNVHNARATRLLADAVVIGTQSPTGRAKLRIALRDMAAHSTGQTIVLPADIVAIPEFLNLVSNEIGDRFEVVISTLPLPEEAIAAARKRQAKRQERAQGCSNPDCTAAKLGCANGKKGK